jgi:LPS-assembly protein
VTRAAHILHVVCRLPGDRLSVLLGVRGTHGIARDLALCAAPSSAASFKTSAALQTTGSARHSSTWASAAAPIAAVLMMLGVVSAPALAQDPSLRTQGAAANKSFPTVPGGIFGAAPKINSALPLNLQGDQLVYDTKGQKIIARGNVEIFYNNFVLTADQVTYDQARNLLIAEGNAQLRDPNGNITRAEKLEATDDFRDAFVQSLSVVTKDETRIAARRATRRDGNITDYEQAKFTPCKNDPGTPPLWCISAARIVHDQNAAKITYQDAKFEFFGVPVLALPYFEHADPSVKRKSGFLAPGVGSSSTLGFRFEVPYYFALSPNYDFTFVPEYLTKQGLLLKGEFRQKLANGQYNIKFGALNQDVGTLGGEADKKLDGWRGTIESRGQFSLGSWWKAGWDVTLESDKSFRRFYGFDGALQTDRVNTAYLQGLSERNYFNAQVYHFGGLLLDDSATASSRVHPVVDYNYIAANSVLGGELAFSGHARSMTRPNGLTAANLTTVEKALIGTDTTHVVTEASWRRKIIDGIGQTWTPFFSARGDAYSFSDTRNPTTGLEAPSESRLFGVGTAALTYAYPFVAHAASGSHTIEPTVQVVSRHMNRPDQRFLPNEDAKSLNFNEGLLFDLNKTSGYDRIDTGTRVNAGIQYAFQANNGFHARAVFGQSFHLAGQNVFTDPGLDVTSTATAGSIASAFNPASGLETNRSDYVAGLYISPLRNLSVVLQSRFDDNNLQLRRQDALVSGTFGPVFMQTAYTYTAGDPLANFGRSQQELQSYLGLKLTDNWSLIGSMRYDLDQSQRIQDSIAVKYADDCFVLTGTYSETFIENAALGVKPDKTFMLRFELKHLGEFNYKTDVASFLSRGDNQ